MSLRQSLIMSDGTWLIFLQRPVSMILLAVSAALLMLAAYGAIVARRDWRTKLAEAEVAES
jgi:TctA family transporter